MIVCDGESERISSGSLNERAAIEASWWPARTSFARNLESSSRVLIGRRSSNCLRSVISRARVASSGRRSASAAASAIRARLARGAPLDTTLAGWKALALTDAAVCWFGTVAVAEVSASAASSDSSEEDSLEVLEVDRVSPLFLSASAGIIEMQYSTHI